MDGQQVQHTHNTCCSGWQAQCYWADRLSGPCGQHWHPACLLLVTSGCCGMGQKLCCLAVVGLRHSGCRLLWLGRLITMRSDRELMWLLLPYLPTVLLLMPLCSAGSKWTAMTPTLGWRHFRIIAVRRVSKEPRHNSSSFLLLQASCDSSAQLWVNAATVRNRACWAAGWLQLSELSGETADGMQASVTSSGHTCHLCAGVGFRACPACDGRGRADLVEL